MWFLKFTFIALGVMYELLHYAVTTMYNGVSRKVSAYLYKPNKGQAQIGLYPYLVIHDLLLSVAKAKGTSG